MSSDLLQFLQVEFQQQLEKADYLFKKVAPEETPYVYKYQSRKIMEDLLKNEYLSEILDYPEENSINIEDEDKQKQICAKMIININLGNNYQETEEGGQSDKFFKIAFNMISLLSSKNVPFFYNHLQEVYNMLGLIYMNRDENSLGLSLLGKSVDLYNSIKQAEIPKVTIINNSQNYTDKTKQQFNYFYEGGICSQKTESLHTLTLFYLAQGYTKVDQKEKAAKYCGLTMKRQFESNTYDLKDFCVNCMSLAEFYGNIKNYKQAQYLILSALAILPENGKQKMRATLEMSLGFLLYEYMETSVRIILEERLGETEIVGVFNRQDLNFEGLNIQMKEVDVKKDIEEVKSIFRQANTQFKKALQYFVLDGYVTEHIQIAQGQSNLYKCLMQLEPDVKKQIGLGERRLELLEPIFKEINRKAFEATWEQLLCQVAEIYNELFELKFKELFVDAQHPPKGKMLIKMNVYGENLINCYSQIFELLLNDKETERNQAFYNSIITAKFNIAKAWSKIYREGREQAVTALVNSLKAYQWISQYIDKDVPNELKAQHYEFEQQKTMCDEMIALLPKKIDKANAQEWSK